MTQRDRTIAQIRARRMMQLTARRRRLPRQIQPDGIRLEYFKAIRSLVLEPARALVVREVLPLAYALLRVRGDATRFDADGKKVNEAIDRISATFYDKTLRPYDLEALARKMAQRTSSFQNQQLTRQVKAAIGVDLAAATADIGGKVSNFVSENVALIKSIPNRYFDDVEKNITRAISSGMRHEELAEVLQERYNVAESSAKLVARDQIGKFYGALNQERQTALGVDAYIWQTANDARVRDEHAERQGERFTWDNPPEDGHPGEPILCRCNADPDFTAILESL